MVEKPKFRWLLEYTHLQPLLHVPHHASVKIHVMKMGKDTIADVKKMIQVFVQYLTLITVLTHS